MTDAMPSRRDVLVGGHRIAVTEFGPAGDQAPVLAVHGFGSSADATWVATGHVRTLLAAGRQVLAPDLLGHGRSDTPHDPAAYRLDGLVADLRAVVDGLGPVDVLGYSLGSRLSAGLAVNTDVVRRLVLGGYDARALWNGVDMHSLGRRFGGDPVELDDQTRRIADIAYAGRGNDLQALVALVVGLPVSAGPLPVPTVPTLVAAGTDDPLADGAAEFAATLPAGEFLAIPGRDHVSALTAAVFRRAVAAFLGVR